MQYRVLDVIKLSLMSFDLWMQNIPAHARTVADIPDDFEPRSIGSRAELIAKIIEAAPNARFENLSHGEIENKNFSINVRLGDDDEVICVTFNIYGDARNALPIVAKILKRCGQRALWTGEDGIFDPNELRI